MSENQTEQIKSNLLCPLLSSSLPLRFPKHFAKKSIHLLCVSPRLRNRNPNSSLFRRSPTSLDLGPTTTLLRQKKPTHTHHSSVWVFPLWICRGYE
ncbi:hypothetical protein Bca4012_072138 [Brassica carinata]